MPTRKTATMNSEKAANKCIAKFARSDFARGKRKTPQAETCGVSTAILLAETEGFEPSIQVLAQMLP